MSASPAPWNPIPRVRMLLAGPYPDQASAAVSAVGLIAEALVTIGAASTARHRNGARPPD